MALFGNRDGSRATGLLLLSALWVAVLVGYAAGEIRAFAVVLALCLAVAVTTRVLIGPMMGWGGRHGGDGLHGTGW